MHESQSSYPVPLLLEDKNTNAVPCNLGYHILFVQNASLFVLPPGSQLPIPLRYEILPRMGDALRWFAGRLLRMYKYGGAVFVPPDPSMQLHPCSKRLAYRRNWELRDREYLGWSVV